MSNIFRSITHRFSKKKNYLQNRPFQINDKWLGSDYGGFFVATEILDFKKNQEIIVYSAGVGTDISFDKALMRRYRTAKIYAFDPTPISVEWIKRKKTPANFIFHPIGIGTKNGKEQMFLPSSHRVSFTIHQWDEASKEHVEVEMKTINSIAEQHGHSFVDVLKMDIEGSEFEVLKALDFSKLSFGQILVEFHERFVENGVEIKNETIKRLETHGYICFAISSDYEYSFINKRLL